MQQCSFSPLLSFTSTADDVRSPGLESATAASKSCEWGGRGARTHTHTKKHTHNKLRVYCTDVALVRAAGFRLHSNKGIHLHTPHLLTRTQTYSIPRYKTCSLSLPACQLTLKKKKRQIQTDLTETNGRVRLEQLCATSF